MFKCCRLQLVVYSTIFHFVTCRRYSGHSIPVGTSNVAPHHQFCSPAPPGVEFYRLFLVAPQTFPKMVKTIFCTCATLIVKRTVPPNKIIPYRVWSLLCIIQFWISKISFYFSNFWHLNLLGQNAVLEYLGDNAWVSTPVIRLHTQWTIWRFIS